MLGTSPTLTEFRIKYHSYINFREFLFEMIPIRNKYALVYNANLQQSGGVRGNNLKLVNELLEKFNKYKIKIDTLESTDNNITINLITINEQIVCFALVLDFVNQVGTILNLYYDAHCLPDLEPKEVTNHMMKLIKEIAIQSKMKKLELSDSSKFYCPTNSKYELDLKYANTLTSGEPYYYKFGFKFDDKSAKKFNHENVKSNKKLLSKLKTSDLNIRKFLKLCNKAMQELKLDNPTIESINKYINKTWAEYSENPIIDFFNEIKYNMCVVFSLIYMELYQMLGLKLYSNNLMYLNLE